MLERKRAACRAWRWVLGRLFQGREDALDEGGVFAARDHFQPPVAAAARQVAGEQAFAHMNLAFEGSGKEKVDTAEIGLAIEWAERARSLGNFAGTNLLYMIYSHGCGVPVDLPKPLGFLREVVEHHHPGVMTNYALMLYSGTPEVP